MTLPMCCTGAAPVAPQISPRSRSRSLPIDSHEANLDQLVRIERALDFHEHGRCKARIADQDDRSEGMGTRFQYLALGGSQWV